MFSERRYLSFIAELKREITRKEETEKKLAGIKERIGYMLKHMKLDHRAPKEAVEILEAIHTHLNC